MALTSVTKDFVVKSGIHVEGTSTVSSSTGQLASLQVDGGAAIAKNLIVGSTATVYGPASFLGTVNVVGQTTLGALTATVFTATSAHIIGDATVDGSVITTLVTSTSYLVLGAGGTSNDVEIQTNGHATQFLAGGQIRPSGVLMGSSYDSNQVDVTNVGPLLLKGLAYGIELTTSPNTSSTYVWSYGTDGTLTNPGNVIVQSVQASTSSNSGALTVAGGAGIAGALNVGGIITANSSTLATVGGAGALVVTGGEFIGGNLIVASTASDTATNFSNALYVQGGAWIDKNFTVGGPATFSDTVTFNGTATYVYSTNTYYTDNIIELHVPPTGMTGTWTVNDGKDIGIRIHYYGSGADQNAALVLANDTKYLEWYSTGAELTTGTFTGASYGTFKTGNILLTGTGDSSSTITGSLQLVGGAGIGQNLYVGANVSGASLTARGLATATNNLVYADSNGQLQITSVSFNGGTISGTITYANTATNLIGGARGSLPYQDSTGTTVMLPIGNDTQVLTVSGGVPTWASASGTTVGNASNAVTATNIASGLANQIPYQQAPGKTIFSSGLTFNGTVFTATNIVVNSGNNATTSTGYGGALMVQGGVGIRQDLWVGGDVNIGGNLYFKGVGADTITSSTGTFVDILVTGTGVSLVVTDSASVGKNLQVGGVFTATGGIVTNRITGSSSTFIGSISGNVMTVTSATDGTIAWGQEVTGAAYDTYVVIQLTQTSGNPGGRGTYQVSNTQTLASTSLAVQSIFVDGDIKLIDGHGIFVQDADNSYLYDNLISIFEDDATIKVGSINTNGLSLNNNKEFKSESALNTGTFMALAKVDGSDNVIISSGNANTTQIRVGGDNATGFGYAQKFFNGGEAHIPVGLRIGNNINPGPYGAAIEVTTTAYSGLSLVSYKDSTSDPYGSFIYGARFHGTLHAPLPVTQDDWLMEFGANAWDGATLNGGGEIAWRGDGPVVAGVSNPSRFELYVTTASSVNETLGLVVNSNLQVITYGDLKVPGTITATNIVISGQSTLHAVTATVVTATSVTISGTLGVTGQSTLGALTATIFTATNATISGTLGVTGQSTLGALTATVFTATSANIIGAETVGGILTVNTTTDSSLTTNGAVIVAGGVGVGKSMNVGGSITIGSSITSSTVAAIYSNNSLYSSFTSGVITNNSQKSLDTFSSTAYRTAKYLVQIVDGSKVHIEEMLVFHDTTYVYMTEYGIATTNGELGTFDAVIGGGSVTLNFTPNYTPSAMTIKVVRTAITF